MYPGGRHVMKKRDIYVRVAIVIMGKGNSTGMRGKL